MAKDPFKPESKKATEPMAPVAPLHPQAWLPRESTAPPSLPRPAPPPDSPLFPQPPPAAPSPPPRPEPQPAPPPAEPQPEPEPPRPEPPTTPGPRRSWKQRLRRWAIIGSVSGLALAAIAVAVLWAPFMDYRRRADAINLEELSNYTETNLFFDRNDEELGRIFVENRVVLEHGDIPDFMRQAVIAVEDERFYKHRGLDPQGFARAMLTNIRQMRFAQGGSTLTQQLSKHLIGTFEKSIDRKVLEALLALRIEKAFDKEAILDFYLNRIYFGQGYFGIEAAAQGYFGKPAKELTVGECAMLAGIIKAPNRWSPRRDFITARFRRNVVLDKMVSCGFITTQQLAEARAQKIVVQPRKPSLRATFFTSVVSKELNEVLGLDEDEAPQGLRVYTTFDKTLQEAAEEELRKALEQIEAQPQVQERMLVANAPKESLEGAALVVEAKTGEVRVLIGGRDFLKNQFEHVTMARRENGSLLQPVVYALAFQDLGIHPASMINATFITDAAGLSQADAALGDPDRDLKARFLTVQDALALGNQASATRVGLQLGPDRLGAWFASAGVGESAATNRADAVWNMSPLTLWETVSLYQVLANAGEQRKLHTIRKIVNSQGAVLFSRDKVEARRALDPVVAQQTTLTLQAVTREGIGRSLAVNHAFPVPVVGMPGYSAGYRDAWFAGYTTDLVGGVWVGFDKSIPIGDKNSAANASIPLWSAIMARVLAEEEEPRGGPFPVPKDVLTKVEVDRRTGVVKGLAHLNPAPGHIFAYLRQSQLEAAKRPSAEVAAQVRESGDWSDWFGSLFAASMDNVGTADIPNPDDYAGDVIPRVAEYRMPGLRGNISSADGALLATTEQFTALILPWPGIEVAPTPDEAIAWATERLDAAIQWLGVSNIEINPTELRTRYQFQRFHPIPVYDQITAEQIEAFPRSPLAELGFALQEYPRRVYPEGTLAAHTVGYLKRTQGRNWGRYVAQEVIYDDYAGAAGLELVFNDDLAGKPGKFLLTTTPDGFCQKATVVEEAGFGATLLTTLNARLQRAAETALSTSRRGAIVVLRVDSGDTAALASWPIFDPNDFVPSVAPELWQSFVTSRLNPLLPRCHRQPNPPGSTFKTVTAIAALQSGTFDPNRTVNANGCYRVGSIEFRLPRETRPVSFHEALTLSFNSYFMDTGIRAGRDNLIRTAFDMGLGRPTGILLPDEHPGLFPTPEFVLKTHQRNMGNGDVANASIGQGDVLTTPIQMANWMAAIANGGLLYRPRVVSALVDERGRVVKEFPSEVIHRANLNAEMLAPLRDAMVSVTEQGTGKQAKVPGMRVAGKTGTAQVGSKSKPRQIAWFGGYLPADNPEFAFAVMVEGDFDQDLHGGSTAGTVAGELFRAYYGAEPAKKTAANP